MALLELTDFEARYGSVPAEDQDKVEAILEDASALILAVAKTDWDEETVPASVIPVVVSVARRLYENPDGYSMEMVGEYQWQRPQAAAATFMTDEEMEIIRRATGSKSGFNAIALEHPFGFHGPLTWSREIDGNILWQR